MRQLLLVGGGHSQLPLLKWLATHERPRNVRIRLISPFGRPLYSGMVPGWLAGHYTLDDCMIPLRRLAQDAHIEFIESAVTRLDVNAGMLHLADGRTLSFSADDLLSLDVGSAPNLAGIDGASEHGWTARPMEILATEWQRFHASTATDARVRHISIIGGGAGGVELACAAAWRDRHNAKPSTVVRLFAGRRGILPDSAPHLRKLATQALARNGVIVSNERVTRLEKSALWTTVGTRHVSHLKLLTTGSAPHPWLRDSGLTLDERGYVVIDDQLRSVSHPHVFAAGDTASMARHSRPKSGVYAVRMGPPLCANLLASLEDRALQSYVPQKRALYLLSTGGQHAIAAWGRFAWQAAWVWRWKNHLDQRFLRRYASPTD